MKEFDKFVKENTTWLDNEYISSTLLLTLIVYSSLVAPKLPNNIIKLFDYTIVKVIFFFFIVFISRKNATIAIAASLALLISIMILNKIKFNEEMMTNVNTQYHPNTCKCECDCLNGIIPMTYDGKLIIEEAKNAVNNNVLPILKAEELAKNIVIAESKGEPVLVPKTEDGLKRLDEIENSLKNGKINEETAKKMLSVIIVAENIISEKTEELSSVKTEEISSSVGSISMAEMAEEVLRRKEEEINKKGGIPLTVEELKKICANVMGEYKKSNMQECSDIISRENSDVLPKENSDMTSKESYVESNDPMMSSYAPIK